MSDKMIEASEEVQQEGFLRGLLEMDNDQFAAYMNRIFGKACLILDAVMENESECPGAVLDATTAFAEEVITLGGTQAEGT